MGSRRKEGVALSALEDFDGGMEESEEFYSGAEGVAPAGKVQAKTNVAVMEKDKTDTSTGDAEEWHNGGEWGFPNDEVQAEFKLSKELSEFTELSEENSKDDAKKDAKEDVEFHDGGEWGFPTQEVQDDFLTSHNAKLRKADSEEEEWHDGSEWGFPTEEVQAFEKEMAQEAEEAKKKAPTEEDAAVETAFLFAMMDINGDGKVHEQEFRKYLNKFGYGESASDRIFSALNSNGDGEIQIEEVREMVDFVHGNLDKALPENIGSNDKQLAYAQLRRIEARRIFGMMDTNKDGEVSPTELQSYLTKNGYSNVAAEAVFRSIDSNKDGKISQDELFDGFEKFSKLRMDCLDATKNWCFGDECELTWDD